MNQHGFVFLPSYFSAINRLADADRLALYDAVMRYAFESIEPEGLQPVHASLFDLLRPNIDSGISRYRSKCENGAKGGKAPKRGANGKRCESDPIPTTNKESDTENAEDLECEEESAQARPRDLNAVTEFFTANHLRSVPAAFFNYYEARGWQVKDWRAAAQLWEQRERELHPEKYSDEKPLEWLSQNPFE